MVSRVRIYDNGGKTADRYTLVIGTDPKMRKLEFFGMSDNPLDPNGFNQYAGSSAEGNQAGRHLGKKVSYESLPRQVKIAIQRRAKDVGQGGWFKQPKRHSIAAIKGARKKYRR